MYLRFVFKSLGWNNLSNWHLVHVKDEVKLADILKALVQSFNKNLEEQVKETVWASQHKSGIANLNQVQDAEFRLAAVDTEDKVESGIVTIDQLVVRST